MVFQKGVFHTSVLRVKAQARQLQSFVFWTSFRDDDLCLIDHPVTIMYLGIHAEKRDAELDLAKATGLKPRPPAQLPAPPAEGPGS